MSPGSPTPRQAPWLRIGLVRRLITRYGWRVYAIAVLSVVTVVAVLEPSSGSAAPSRQDDAAAHAPATSPSPTPKPSTLSAASIAAHSRAAAAAAAAASLAALDADACKANTQPKLVLVSVARQRAWMCAANHLLKATAVTTGKLTDGDGTPSGTWQVYAKQTDRDLVGPGYDEFVHYWVPFNGDFGFHDASWQTMPFGSPNYRTLGSHGCVHLPAGIVAWFYNWVEVGTTVTVHACEPGILHVFPEHLAVRRFLMRARMKYLAMTRVPFLSVQLPNAAVSTVDNLATEAGVEMLRRGGTAVDAAIAANAVLGVTLPNQCGLGGDLFALVHRPGQEPDVLSAAGRAGSGADAKQLRAQGYYEMPAERDVRSVTVPGCVDGWIALHARFGRLPLADLLAPATRYAAEGFPASEFFAGPLAKQGDVSTLQALGLHTEEARAGSRIRRPGVARTLQAIVAGGRAAFYEGEFGASLIELGAGLFTEADLQVDQAEWTKPVTLDVWGARLWGPPPPSQSYVTLAAAWLAEQAGLGADPEDPQWAHLLIESMRQAAYDRPAVLFDGADGQALLDAERLGARVPGIRPDAVADLDDSYRHGGTTYLCAVDAEGMAVSLMQSNAMSFGSGLVAGQTGVWLHNRGIGFSLEEGHPGEYAPGRRPAHTLAPLLVTDTDNQLRAIVGTRGGDSQPQVVLQLLARLLVAGQDPATALAAGRWVLRGEDDETSFNTWGFAGRVRVALEGQVPATWADALAALGHQVLTEEEFGHQFGHAQVIQAVEGMYAGSADPRSGSGAAAGF